MELNLAHTGSEVNPEFANVVSPSEVVVVSAFVVEVEGGGGELHITTPYSMIEPLREVLDAGVQSDASDIDERWIKSLREEMQQAPVVLNSTLTSTEVTVRELIALKTGDVIPVEIPDHVTATVDGVPILRAKYGVSRGTCALQVLEYVKSPLQAEYQESSEQADDG
jgi:flagellar motor switch protein FliM